MTGERRIEVASNRRSEHDARCCKPCRRKAISPCFRASQLRPRRTPAVNAATAGGRRAPPRCSFCAANFPCANMFNAARLLLARQLVHRLVLARRRGRLVSALGERPIRGGSPPRPPAPIRDQSMSDAAIAAAMQHEEDARASYADAGEDAPPPPRRWPAARGPLRRWRADRGARAPASRRARSSTSPRSSCCCSSRASASRGAPAPAEAAGRRARRPLRRRLLDGRAAEPVVAHRLALADRPRRGGGVPARRRRRRRRALAVGPLGVRRLPRRRDHAAHVGHLPAATPAPGGGAAGAAAAGVLPAELSARALRAMLVLTICIFVDVALFQSASRLALLEGRRRAQVDPGGGGGGGRRAAATAALDGRRRLDAQRSPRAQSAQWRRQRRHSRRRNIKRRLVRQPADGGLVGGRRRAGRGVELAGSGRRREGKPHDAAVSFCKHELCKAGHGSHARSGGPCLPKGATAGGAPCARGLSRHRAGRRACCPSASSSAGRSRPARRRRIPTCRRG